MSRDAPPRRFHRQSRTSRPVILAVGFAALFLLWQAIIGPGPMWGDSVQYARITLEIQNTPSQEAWKTAFQTWCEHPSITISTPVERCVEAAINQERSSFAQSYQNPRYQDIFTPRIGYPILSIPFVNMFGIYIGLWIVPLLLTVLTGIIIYVIAKLLGLGVPGSLLAQVLFYVLPVGQTGAQLLTEGPTMFATMTVLLGAVLLFKSRFVWGATLIIVGQILVFFFRYSSALMTALSFLAVFALLAISKKYRRLRAVRIGVLVFVASTAFFAILGSVMHLPGLMDSLQDTFTDHFERPDIDDPFFQLLQLNIGHLGTLVASIGIQIFSWIIVALAAYGFWRCRDSGQVLLPLAFAVLGVATVAAHPVWSQTSRLVSPLWVAVAFGIALLVRPLLSRINRPRPLSNQPADNRKFLSS